MNRIAERFAELKRAGRPGLVTFITAGDPDRAASQRLLNGLPQNGADFIELGMPFSDPMADGPVIQEASQRALKSGATVDQTLSMAASFRVTDAKTPLIMMGYFNPIYAYGTERFAVKAKESGVDGLIVVDLPPEEDEELNGPARNTGLDIIRLVTPTTDVARLSVILKNAGGFIYYVAVTGITGTASADASKIAPHLSQIRKMTRLPIAVGFGIKTPADAAALSTHADAVVVGSALVKTIGAGKDIDKNLSAQVKELADALRG